MKKQEFTLNDLRKENVNVEFTLNGKEFKITGYFVSQKDRDGKACKGRQTAIDYVYDAKKFTDVTTESFKNEFFPNRERTTHATKSKVNFEEKINTLLATASRAQLKYTVELIALLSAKISEREKAEKEEKIKALEAELKKLKSE